MRIRLARYATNVATIFLVVSIWAVWINASAPEDVDGVAVREVGKLPLDPFLDQFPGAFAETFDVSPDGTEIAIEFEVFEEGGTSSQWITLWDTDTLSLKASRRLEEPQPAEEWSVQFGQQIRYVTDGSSLIVLTGPRALLLNASDLTVIRNFPPNISVDKHSGEMFAYRVSICDSRNHVALLRIHHRVFGQTFTVRTYSVNSGQVIDEWSGEGQATDIAYSPNCEAVAVSTVSRLARSDENILFIYKSGQLDPANVFSPGHAVGDMFFDGKDRLATIAGHHLAFEFYKTDSIRVWDIHSGRLVEEYGYPKYGLRGTAAVSRNNRLMAVVTEWENPVDLKLDTGRDSGFSRFIVWDLTAKRMVFVSGDLEGEFMSPSGEGQYLARVSADGRTLVVGGRGIMIYHVAMPG